jgi:hypothetical protein
MLKVIVNTGPGALARAFRAWRARGKGETVREYPAPARSSGRGVRRGRRSPRGLVAALLVLGPSGGLAVGACKGAPPVAAADAATDEAAASDAVDVEAAPPDAGHGSLTKVGATAQTSIVDGPFWPESGKGSRRAGYLRHGAVVAAFDRPIVNSDCKEGWYELSIGGYVCGKAVTTELASPKVRLAPKQPDHDAGMPYRYGVNISDDTPLYRRVLPTEERKKFEPWLAPPKPAPEEPTAAPEEKVEAAPDEEGSPAPRRAEPKEKDAGVDAGRPKLKELKGRGVLVRKMARGFYLALDRTFHSGGARWWRTTFGFAVPFERILLQTGRTKHLGSWFNVDPKVDVEAVADRDAGATEGDGGGNGGDGGDAASSAGTVAFVTVGFARKVTLEDDKDGAKKLIWGAELPKRSAVMLTGRAATAAGQAYHETTSGFWVRLLDVSMARPLPPPDLGPDEKWIDVDLTRQALVAFQGTRPVFATLISSGRRNPSDKEHDFPTPTGTFRVREKHVTTTMDGDVASDGPYSIEDVPWVMYFQGSYALHGAFWHDEFGRMRSHGCVNLAPEDARTLFGWTEPPLPAGWHGVFSKDDQSGTRIVIHEDKRAGLQRR